MMTTKQTIKARALYWAKELGVSRGAKGDLAFGLAIVGEFLTTDAEIAAHRELLAGCQ
jgi:hypothetical protein